MMEDPIDFSVEDINEKTFNTVLLHGYCIHEVDDFMDLVASEFEKLQEENKVLGEKVRGLEKKVNACSRQPDQSIEERLEELERRLQAQ